jgi:cytidine deaminase
LNGRLLAGSEDRVGCRLVGETPNPFARWVAWAEISACCHLSWLTRFRAASLKGGGMTDETLLDRDVLMVGSGLIGVTFARTSAEAVRKVIPMGAGSGVCTPPSWHYGSHARGESGMPLAVDDQARKLCQTACDAAKFAHAKYSNFRVGAALVTGKSTYSAANVENASYGLSLCAERAAIAQAVSAGDKHLIRIAVACIDASPEAGLSEAMPCGACRQWFIEFAPDLEVFIWSNSGEIVGFTAQELLYMPFTLRT